MTPIFTFTSGRKVNLQSFHVRETYAGLMEGTPQRSWNAGYIAQSLQSIESMWGSRPYFLIPPIATTDARFAAISTPEDPIERLPSWTYMAWFDSEPLRERYCGSELVLVWLGEPHFDLTIADLIGIALQNVNWDTAAKDFDY